jgi:type IV secretory pathway VirB6-like protein
VGLHGPFLSANRRFLMNIKIINLLSGIALGLGTVTVYAEENHLQQAVEHTMMAAKQTDGKAVAQHAQEALKHAAIADQHLDAGIKSLQEAADQGNQDNGGAAQKAAEEATQHLTAAQ